MQVDQIWHMIFGLGLVLKVQGVVWQVEVQTLTVRDSLVRGDLSLRPLQETNHSGPDSIANLYLSIGICVLFHCMLLQR